jgi:ABC-type branched-subunit amino acid transport system substrate-binding protein
MNRLRAIALAAAIALLAIACGSTSNTNVTRTDDPSAVSSDTPSATSHASPSATDAAGRPVTRGTVSVPRTTPQPGAVTTPVAGLERGTGTIKIGFHYSSDLDAAYRAFGASGNFFDVEQAVNSLVKWVNARGGLGGKKVVAVFHTTNPLSGTFPEQAEKACTFFAEDAKVSYVVSGAVLPDDNMPACFARRNLPLVWDYQYVTSQTTFDRFANTLYMPHNIATQRMGFSIAALNSAKFFDAGAKIGLVRYDTAAHKEYADKVVKPALTKIGRKVLVEAALTKPQSAGEAGYTANQAASAILRMHNSGVTHLLWVPSGGAIPLIWGNAADSQNFHPRNAFTSLDIPTFITDNLSEEQLDRSMVVGWMPANDTYMQYVPKTPPIEDCKKATGVADNTGIARYCDGLFFLKAALDRTPLYGVSGLRKAADALGTTYRSPWTISTRITSGRHDGATSYRMMTFNAGCFCFRFSSDAKPTG